MNKSDIQRHTENELKKHNFRQWFINAIAFGEFFFFVSCLITSLSGGEIANITLGICNGIMGIFCHLVKVESKARLKEIVQLELEDWKRAEEAE